MKNIPVSVLAGAGLIVALTLAGCALGWVTSLLINRVIDIFLARQGLPHVAYFAFPLWIFLGAVGFAVLVSLVSGIYPARRAARVDPVVALRHD